VAAAEQAAHSQQRPAQAAYTTRRSASLRSTARRHHAGPDL